MQVTIPANTLVSIAREPDRQWLAHTTRRTVTGEVIGGRSGAVVVRVEGWLVLTRRDRVRRHAPAQSGSSSRGC